MRFTWQDPKRQANLTKHGVDFADAEWVFAGPTFTFEDDCEDYSEQRWVVESQGFMCPQLCSPEELGGISDD